MAKFIKTIVDRINLATKKGLCSYFSPDQIVTEVHAESMNLWDKFIEDFESTKKLDVFMRPFQGKEDVILAGGIGAIVTKDFINLVESNIGVEVKQIDDERWPTRKNHSVKIPTIDYPICNINNQDIEVLPNTIPTVKVWFLQRPTKPVYAFTVISGRYVYDDAGSSDFEWNEILHDRIMNRVLGNLGISLRDGELLNQSARDKATEGL